VRLQAREKQLTVAIEADRALELQANPRLVRSALTNLLQNAVKFSRRAATVWARAVQKAGSITITVDDACAHRRRDARAHLRALRAGLRTTAAVSVSAWPSRATRRRRTAARSPWRTWPIAAVAFTLTLPLRA